MIIFELLHPRMTHAMLGFVPDFFSNGVDKPAREQLNDNYAHGGGYSEIKGFTFNKENLTLKYPGDPLLQCLARSKLHDEQLFFFDHALLVILQPSGEWAVTRVD